MTINTQESTKKKNNYDQHLPWIRGENQRIKVAIVGDIIIDEYLEGDVSRISPEAPVPVHLVKAKHQTGGGAANVARNIKLAGGEPLLFGVCGNDSAGQQLKAILEKDYISTDFILASSTRPTVSKCRVSSAHQQLLRIDWEDRTPINDKEQTHILNGVKNESYDLLLISDYAKGTLPDGLIIELIKAAKAKGIPTIIDPKGTDFNKYRGADIITPNLKEAVEALGISNYEDVSGEFLGRQLQEKFGLDNILVTMGAKGMAYVPKDTNAQVIYQPTVARDVFDVTGAGDTVAAIISLAFAAGAEPQTAVKLANTAAGIVVEKWGVKAITSDELLFAMNANPNRRRQKTNSLTKILEIEDLDKTLNDLRKEEFSIVFTNGCFDILHAGHISYLENAAAAGDILIIGINGDESIQRLKGTSRPIVPLPERMRLVASLGCVDYVVAFNDDTPIKLIKKIMPNVLVKGADWELEKIVGAKEVMEAGGEVKRMPVIDGLSTSDIIEKIKRTE